VTTILPGLAYMSVIANRYLGPLNGVLFMDVVPSTAFVISALTGVIPAGMQVVGASPTAPALVFNTLYLRRVAQRTAAAAAARAATEKPAVAATEGKTSPVAASR
jgi:hypothetical protein